jgi:hypothetical protein
MTKLIALFSNDWINFIASEGQRDSEFERKANDILSTFWDKALKSNVDAEVAVFLPSLLESKDRFPNSYRRFIQVGATREEKNRNAIELCFEKGYDQILFVDYFSFQINPGFVTECFAQLNKSDILLVPSENGSLSMVGMNLDIFPYWTNYCFSEPQEVVEILSQCLEKNLSYALMHEVSLENGKVEILHGIESPKN